MNHISAFSTHLSVRSPVDSSSASVYQISWFELCFWRFLALHFWCVLRQANQFHSTKTFSLIIPSVIISMRITLIVHKVRLPIRWILCQTLIANQTRHLRNQNRGILESLMPSWTWPPTWAKRATHSGILLSHSDIQRQYTRTNLLSCIGFHLGPRLSNQFVVFELRSRQGVCMMSIRHRHIMIRRHQPGWIHITPSMGQEKLVSKKPTMPVIICMKEPNGCCVRNMKDIMKPGSRTIMEQSRNKSNISKW